MTAERAAGGVRDSLGAAGGRRAGGAERDRHARACAFASAAFRARYSFFCALTEPCEHFANFEMVLKLKPASSSDSMSAEFLLRARPILAPLALAAARPFLTRSAIRSLSSCAIAEIITNTTWPKLVFRSSFSESDTKFVLWDRMTSRPFNI